MYVYTSCLCLAISGANVCHTQQGYPRMSVDIVHDIRHIYSPAISWPTLSVIGTIYFTTSNARYKPAQTAFASIVSANVFNIVAHLMLTLVNLALLRYDQRSLTCLLHAAPLLNGCAGLTLPRRTTLHSQLNTASMLALQRMKRGSERGLERAGSVGHSTYTANDVKSEALS